MSNVVYNARRQSAAYLRKGTGAGATAQQWSSELFGFANVAVGVATSIQAAVAGSRIRVISYSLSGAAAGAATATFNSASSAKSPLISLGANGFAAESDPLGLFETNVGEALTLTVTGNTVGVRFTYVLVD
jgi:hypothetical protein